MDFSERLTQLRTQRGLSQEELAARLGVSRQTIGKWETGQALPELPGLLALSDFFSTPIDRLVREDPCATPIEAPGHTEPFLDFLLRAKRSTYAAHAPEVPPCCPGAHDYYYAAGPLAYRDNYFGGSCFHGRETVWSDGTPLWCMNYSGRVLGEPFSGDFLKEALLHGTPDMPCRGPELYRSGDYTYTCFMQGSLDWFSGSEAIYLGGRMIYECRFHGGTTR